MIGFQTSFAENASEADMAPQEQAETQIADDGEELEQVENTAQPQPTLDAAQDNEVEEDQEGPSPSAEPVEDTQPDVEAQNPIFQEGANDVWEIEESPVFQDVGESNVITLSDNEYLITGISSRSLEVYVTDGYNPIPNAQVTICGQTVACDESGYAVFSNIPTADAPYDLIVNCEYGQKTESIALPNTEVVESADAEIPARKATISYWTPEMEISAAVNSAAGVSVMSDISDEENWIYSSSGVTDSILIEEYNGKIYVYGSAFKVYNPANGTWAELTHSYNDEAVFCNGSFYAYYAAWRTDGDDYWAAMYGLSKYNISTNTWTTIDSDDSGGFFDPAITVCGDRIYFGGGFEVIYDESMEQGRYDVSYFDTSDYTWHKYNNVVRGGYTVAVLREDAGAYYNDIFYVDGYCITRFDTDTNTSTTIGHTDGYFYNPDNSLQHAAVYKNGTIYLAGRTDSESYNINKYNIADNAWSNIDSLIEAEAYSMVEYNNKLYTWGSSSDHSIFYINDIVTGSSSHDYFNYAFGDDSAIVYNGKIYAISNDGTLAIFDAAMASITITPELTLTASGSDHAAYIKDGAVYTKGDNTYGQLGTGNNDSSEAFTEVNGSWGNKEIIKVAARGDTTFALTEDNILYGWGRNDKYQLGNGNNTNVNTPIQIMTDVADVSAGYEHTLALKTNGDVYGFGDNTYGQLASNGTSIHTPVKIYSNAVFIGTGDYHSLIVDNTYSLYTAGRNNRGQLGIGNTTNQNSFNLAMSNVKKAAGGYSHTVVIDIGGNVYTCGDNMSRQLGRAVNNYSTEFASVDTATDIWAGANSTAYLKDSKLYQCGSGIYPPEGYTTQVYGVNDPQCVSIGRECYAVLENSSLRRWGVYSKTDEVLQSSWYDMLTPQQLDCYYKYIDIDSYRTQTLAVDENNEVWAWGEGYYGDGTDKMAIHYSPVRIEGLENIVSVSRGKNHNLALDSSGNVWAWGSNSNYPMGSGIGGKVKTPVVIMSNVKQISAGTEYSVFLKNDGTIWGVGKNNSKQLCDSSETYYSTPIKLSDKSNFVSVVSDETRSAAVDADGNIFLWGGNQSATQVTANFTDGESTKFASVSIGEYHYLALTDAGYVYGWGDNSYGQLGVGDKLNRSEPTLVRVNTSAAALTNIQSVYAGARQSFAITNDGKVYGFGSGASYQLAINNQGTIRYATLITALQNKNIVKMGTGYNFSVALDSDGNIYTFGAGESGALGIYQNDASVDGKINEDYLWLKQQIKAISQPITDDIYLPANAPNGSYITWTSGNTYYIADDGTLVNRPDCYGSDTDVKLTATLTNGSDSITGKYTVTVKQDPTLQPSTDIPIRSLGFEYDQIYPDAAPDVYPEIESVAMSVIDEENGVYQFTIRDDQYTCSQNADPFFFWSARQGAFLPVEGYDDYRSVRFTIDPDALDKNVKVVVGIGDSLGYVDKKSILIDRDELTASAAAVSEENVVSMALNNELNESDYEAVESGVSLAIGLDTSLAMLNFDPSESKNWVDSINGLIDSTTNTNIALVTNKSMGYPVDKDSAKNSVDFIASADYSGTTDAVQLIDRCIEALNNEEKIPQAGNKAVVITVQNITDINALENKISEAENAGISVYVMALSNENAEALSQIDGVYVCGAALELRLNIAELYGAFNNIAQVMSMSNDVSLTSNEDKIIYTSDYRTGEHNFNTARSFGSDIASVLNMYGCLPLVVSGKSGYNVFSTVTSGQTILDLIRGKAYQSSFNEGLSNMISFYDALKSGFSDSSLCTSGNISSPKITDMLDRNLRYSFPVVAFSNEEPNEESDEEPNENSKIITQKVENSSGAVEYLDIDGTAVTGEWSFIDTYDYFTEIIGKGVGIVDYVSETEKLYDNIRFTKPSGYTGDDAYAYIYANNLSAEYRIELSIQGENYWIKSPTADSTILRSVRTDFNGVRPTLYNTNNVYIIKKYEDVKDANGGETWYYQSLFKATNLGIINGDTGKYDPETQTTIEGDGTVVYFNPQKPVSRAEFLKMLLFSAGFDDIAIYGEDVYWAKDVVNKAIELALIRTETTGNEPNESFYEAPIQRYEAAYALYKTYIEQRSEITVPSNLYEYNENVSCERNTRWKSSIAFTEQNMFANQIGGSTTKIAGVNYSDYIEGIYQMYLNGVMEGDENREFGTLRNLTKAEAAKILEKSLFTLDEGLENVKLINEGAANYIDFSLQDTYTINQDSYKSDSNEFYFVAPKTGYYYISDLNNCSVTVSDMKKREIKGLEAYDSATQITNGARYNILKGETAYINVNDAGTSYSFKISIPGDNELTFAPDRSGTFIYDNCPEYIIKDDLADYDKGNTCLITAENLSGSVTMASSHLIRKDVATLGDHSNCCGESKIRFDYLISNLTDSDVTIHINNIGIQTPGKSWSEDFTYKASAGFQEWSDYTGESITNPEMFIGNNIIQTSDGWNYKYMPYTSGTGEWSYNVNVLRGKTIIIPPGETRWLLGDNRPVLDVGTTGYPFGMMINCSIDGVATVSSMVFHREDRVLSPHIGKIYSNSSVRDYSGEDYVGDDLGESGEIGEKYKGVSNSAAVVEAESSWTISDNEESAFFAPSMNNRSWPNGFVPYFSNSEKYNYKLIDGSSGELTEMNYWITHSNSEASSNYNRRIVSSDMLPLEFKGTRVAPEGDNDITGTFYFDNYHRNTNNNNIEISNSETGQGLSINMANFSVTEKYRLTITNDSAEDKTVSYFLSNKTGFCYSYKVSGETETRSIKCETGDIDGDSMMFYELFNFVLEKGTTKTLEFEITIPNVGSSQTSNMLWAR